MYFASILGNKYRSSSLICRICTNFVANFSLNLEQFRFLLQIFPAQNLCGSLYQPGINLSQHFLITRGNKGCQIPELTTVHPCARMTFCDGYNFHSTS